MFQKLRQMGEVSLITWINAILVSILSAVNFMMYLVILEPWLVCTMLVVYGLFILCAWGAHFGKLPALNALIAVFSIWIITLTSYSSLAPYGITMLIQVVVTSLAAIVGTVFALLRKEKVHKIICVFGAILFAVPALFCCVWGVNSALSNAKTKASREIWQVPDVFERTDTTQKGRVEKIDYATKAYATDQRAVTKSAYVYLPYGYNDETQYDILYLLHGTGDDEAYWLVTYEWNKVMLDNMIEQKIIRPVIVVTPTFYVENDCADDLDRLTYSFSDELRNDLMPVVESKYSTYAETADKAGFIESRVHRAFAGLSRGAVTTIHSAICDNLDYFSSFGTFSGSRTPVEYYKEHALSDEFKDYSIDYWYVASGNFDFALPVQVTDCRAIIAADERLILGENISFDVFPMRYHSQGNWHLALYNFLQKIY